MGIFDPDSMSPVMRRPKAVQLELMETVVKRALGADAGVSLAQAAHLVLDDMVAELRTGVLAEKLPPEKVEHTETVTFEHPDGWWQMFRQQHRDRWWMRWSTRRWPVRFQKHKKTVRLSVTLTRFHSFPEATVRLPELGDPVRVTVTEPMVMRWPR